MSHLEKLLLASARPDTPKNERQDVERQLLSEFVQSMTGRDLVEFDPDEVDLMRDSLDQVRTEGMTLQKAVVLNSAYYEMAYPTADGRNYDGRVIGTGRKGILYVNQLGVMGAGNVERWAEKPNPTGGFEFLNYMSSSVDIIQAIHLTRIRQGTAYCNPYHEDDNNPLGYRFARRDNERFTVDDEKETRRLERIVQNCGTEDDATVRRWELRRRTFPEFAAAWFADSLKADWAPIELERTWNGGCAGWYNLPAETIRLAYENGYDGDDSIRAVQLSPDGNVPIVGFQGDEIICPVRNPRSSLALHDYGLSENEVLLRMATSYLNAFTFNSAQLDRNAIPRGFLTLYGKFGKRALNDFRGRWNAMMRGAAHRWNLPVLVSPAKNEGGAAYTPVDTQTHEMLQSQWIIFLISLACACYGMSPEEINIKSFSPNQSSLGGKDTAEKLQSGHWHGFVPMMQRFGSVINDDILPHFTKKYRLVWVGLFPEDEGRKFERQKLVLTVDEMRAQDGEEPHEDPEIGKAPVNPSLMSFYAQNKMMEKQQAMLGGGDQGGYMPGGDDPNHPGGHPSGLPDSELPPPYLRDDQPSPSGARPPALGANPIGQQRQLPPPGAGPMAKAALGGGPLRVTIRHLPC